jgi:hypothetical protein
MSKNRQNQQEIADDEEKKKLNKDVESTCASLGIILSFSLFLFFKLNQ